MPDWFSSMHTVTPWDEPSPLASIGFIAGEEAAFWEYDLFHSYYLGVAKNLGASCIALMSEVMASSNIDGRLDEVNNLYVAWADEHGEIHLPPWLYKSKPGLARHRYFSKWPMVKRPCFDSGCQFLHALGATTGPDHP